MPQHKDVVAYIRIDHMESYISPWVASIFLATVISVVVHAWWQITSPRSDSLRVLYYLKLINLETERRACIGFLIAEFPALAKQLGALCYDPTDAEDGIDYLMSQSRKHSEMVDKILNDRRFHKSIHFQKLKDVESSLYFLRNQLEITEKKAS